MKGYVIAIIIAAVLALIWFGLRFYSSYDRFKYFHTSQDKPIPPFKLKYMWDGPQSNWTVPRDDAENDIKGALNCVRAVFGPLLEETVFRFFRGKL